MRKAIDLNKIKFDQIKYGLNYLDDLDLLIDVEKSMNVNGYFSYTFLFKNCDKKVCRAEYVQDEKTSHYKLCFIQNMERNIKCKNKIRKKSNEF